MLALGEVYEFRVPLWATSYHVAQGHRLRVSVSCADFPRLWPTRTNPQIRVFCGGRSKASAIRLPLVPPALIAGRRHGQGCAACAVFFDQMLEIDI